MTSRSPSTTEALLAELAREPDGVSLPRLCKRLNLRMSVLMRELAWLGEEPIGGQPGPGLVRVERRGERDVAMLTETGRRRLVGATEVATLAQAARQVATSVAPTRK